MDKKRLGIGFIGGGFISRFHIQSLISVRDVDVLGVMSKTKQSAEETADLANATKSVINGTSFDNNLLCIGEKSLFVVQSVANEALSQLTQNGGYLLTNSQLKKLEDLLDGDNEKDYIGKDATEILKAIGINAPSSNTLAILAEVSADHIFVINEYLMPILPIVRVQNFEEALNGAVRAEGGRGHT